jgi:hypothetical protein
VRHGPDASSRPDENAKRHERVAERHHERDVAEEELVATQVAVERVPGVRDAEVHGAVLGEATYDESDEGVHDGSSPADVAHRAPDEHDPEERDVPATDERARALAQQILEHARPPGTGGSRNLA